MKAKSPTKKKLEEKSLLQTIIWLVSIVALLLIISVPKDLKAANILFFVFLVLLFIPPTVLSAYHVHRFFKAKLKFNNIYMLVPFFGLSSYMFIIYFYFLNSLKLTAQNILSIVTFSILGYNVVAILILKYKRMYSFKIHSVLLVVAYILYIALLLLSVYLSWNYSVKW